MKVLIVHNSDEVIAAFVGTAEEIVDKIMKSDHGEDILERVEEERNRTKDDSENDEDIELTASDIGMADIIELHHDGDSQNGYTLLDAE